MNNHEGKIMCMCLHSEIETIDALINHHITDYLNDIKALEQDQISLTVTQIAEQNQLNELLLSCLENYETSTTHESVIAENT